MNDKIKLEKSITALKYLLKDQPDTWEILKNNFSCPRNLDVENFLKVNAERYDNSHNSRTHLIFDKNNLSKGILAYFSLSFKEIILSKNVSKSLIRKLDGISKNSQTVRGFLIGQIGKNDFSGNPINLELIFEEIYTTIYQAQEVVGGRLIFLECENKEKLISLYQANGFEILQEEFKENKQLTFVLMYKIFTFD